MTERNEKIEERIENKVVVDAYDQEDRAMGWWYYVQDNCTFPFQAKCISREGISPLRIGDQVQIFDIGMDEDCEHRIFVEIKWKEYEFSVPLEQLEAIDVDDDTQQVLDDRVYWCDMCYEY